MLSKSKKGKVVRPAPTACTLSTKAFFLAGSGVALRGAGGQTAPGPALPEGSHGARGAGDVPALRRARRAVGARRAPERLPRAARAVRALRVHFVDARFCARIRKSREVKHFH